MYKKIIKKLKKEIMEIGVLSPFCILCGFYLIIISFADRDTYFLCLGSYLIISTILIDKK